MSGRALPPYFAAVAMSVSLVCGAAAYAAASFGQAAAQMQAADARGQAAAVAQAEPRPAVMQDIKFRRLAAEVSVGPTRRTRKNLRKRLAVFRQTIRPFERQGGRIGVYLADLESGESLAYRADEPFYPASSVKGPYVVCVFERLVDAGTVDADAVRALAAPIIVDSDNDAYAALRTLCGNAVFADWAVSCGAAEEGTATFEDLSTQNYPNMSARQLAALWERAYAYLSEDGESAAYLRDLFERRVESPLRAGLGDGFSTISKAGWYPADDGPDYQATVDAGIVDDGERTYVMVVMTDMPDDLGLLAELVPGIFSATTVLR